jgi:deoxyadenosine/deoxycytidine kinase
MEAGIDGEYLSLLESFYHEWMARFDLCPVLTIRSDDLDFVNRPQHLNVVVRRIEDRLSGREELVFD